MSRGNDLLKKRDKIIVYLFEEGAISRNVSIEFSILKEAVSVDQDEFSTICDSLLNSKLIEKTVVTTVGNYISGEVEFQSPIKFWLTETGIERSRTLLASTDPKNEQTSPTDTSEEYQGSNIQYIKGLLINPIFVSIVALLTLIAALAVVPEIRYFLGLQPTPTSVSPAMLEYIGMVVDKNDRSFVEGADVVFKFPSEGRVDSYTDSRGAYRFNITFDGDKLAGRVEVRKDGYRFFDKEVTLERQNLTIGDIHLIRLAPSPTPTLPPSPAPRFTPTPPLSVTAKQAAIATVTALSNEAWVRYGPESGELTRKSRDITIKPIDVTVQDFIISTRFFNPSDAGDNTWSYGFYFRDNPGNRAYFIRVSSRFGWALVLDDVSQDEGKLDYIKKGDLQEFNFSGGEFNDIRLIVRDKLAWLFVNNEFVDIIDLPEQESSGIVALASGFVAEDSMNPIKYEDFTIKSLD